MLVFQIVLIYCEILYYPMLHAINYTSCSGALLIVLALFPPQTSRGLIYTHVKKNRRFSQYFVKKDRKVWCNSTCVQHQCSVIDYTTSLTKRLCSHETNFPTTFPESPRLWARAPYMRYWWINIFIFPFAALGNKTNAQLVAYSMICHIIWNTMDLWFWLEGVWIWSVSISRATASFLLDCIKETVHACENDKIVIVSLESLLAAQMFFLPHLKPSKCFTAFLV